MAEKYILVLHGGHAQGKTEAMSRMIAQGVSMVDGMAVKVRSVKMLDVDPALPQTGDIIASMDDFEHASGIVLGSPTRFGNMSASLKHFIDSASGAWMRGSLVGKPCGFFTSSSSIHGGQESTLLSMMIPMMHMGMVIVGIPYTEPELKLTTTGGTPYGASHYDGKSHAIDENEHALCVALGRRVAYIASKLMA
jgi:NAD(P)H dehydrogenase (quinone)